MPIITFKPSDILRSKVLDAGWYPSEIVKVDMSKASDGLSINTTVSFLIEGTDGKEIERVFNSKAPGFMIPLIAAVTNTQIKPDFSQFDTDSLLHKKVDSKVEHDTYQGRIKNVINDWLPYEVSKTQQAPF